MTDEPRVYKNIIGKYMLNGFNLEFSRNILFLEGDSGDGKSYLRKALASFRGTYEKIDIYDYQWVKKKEEIREALGRVKGHLFVFDNADILLDDDMRKTIVRDENNQYLIIGRDPRGLQIQDENVINLEYKEGVFGFIQE